MDGLVYDFKWKLDEKMRFWIQSFSPMFKHEKIKV